jgi:hypothetical protein
MIQAIVQHVGTIRTGGRATLRFRFFGADSRSRDFGIRDLSRRLGTVCEGRRFLNLGANRAKRVTLWLLRAIKDELLAAAIDEHPSSVALWVLQVIELLP